MFSNRDRLIKRTPKDGVNREEFINLLVDEFLNSQSIDAKQQVLANLANFAYDPINFEFLRKSGALDLFLHEIAVKESTLEDEKKLVHFASSGVCNICLDSASAEYILQNSGIELLVSLLRSDHEETVLNAITTLIYLSEKVPKESLNQPEIIRTFAKFVNSKESPRLQNLATVFMEEVIKL